MSHILLVPQDKFVIPFPPTLPSATTITPTNILCFISGNTPIETIQPISEGAHYLGLVFTHASPPAFLITGNIASAQTPNQNALVLLAFHPVTQKYYPVSSESASATGDVNGPGSSTQDNVVVFGDGTGKLIADSGILIDDLATIQYVQERIAELNVGGASQSSFLIEGGQITWIANYEFTVSTATYYINGVLLNSPQTDITLSAADPTNDRIDIVAVNTSGAVVVIEGTAAAQPSEPDIDPGSQLKLGFILVTANTTEPPTVVNTLLYEDNTGSPTEWNWTTSGVGFNVNSTADPFSGTKCIEGTTVAANAFAQGQIGSGSVVVSDYRLLFFYLKPKATWLAGRGLSITLRSSGVQVGNPIVINPTGSFGFDSSTLSYQLVSIPIELFAIPIGITVNQIRFTKFGAGSNIGFFIDTMNLQIGGASQQLIGITQEQADARYAQLSDPLALVGASTKFPNGRRLLAGTGISFDDTVAGARTINNTVTDTGITQLTGDVAAGPGSGSQAATVKAAIRTRVIEYEVDGGGSAVAVGNTRYVSVPFNCTISSLRILAAQSGDLVLDVWKDTFANYPPTNADSITNGNEPALSGVDKLEDNDLTDWSTNTITAGDVLGFTIDSAATITWFLLELVVVQT